MRNNYFVVTALMMGVFLCGSAHAELLQKETPSLSVGQHKVVANPCKRDKKMTFADMKDKDQNDPKFLAAEKVPMDLEINDKPVHFVVTTLTKIYSLPDANSKSFAGLKPGYKEYANCQVKDPNGKWWLATRSDGSELNYVSSDDVKIVNTGESGEDDNEKSQGE